MAAIRARRRGSSDRRRRRWSGGSGVDDGVGLDELGRPSRRIRGRAARRFGGRAPGDDFEVCASLMRCRRRDPAPAGRPPTRLIVQRTGAPVHRARARLRAGARWLWRRRARAPLRDTSGATITSTNWRLDDGLRRCAPSSSRLKAMMPPKAEVGIGLVGQIVGLADAGPGSPATPQGLACLTMTQAGLTKDLHAFERGVGIGEVVVRTVPCPAAAARAGDAAAGGCLRSR
jgi:hypothetical protein